MGPIIQTAYKLPDYVFSNAQVTGNGWNNPNNLLLVDGDVSESNPGSSASDVTLGYNFAFPTDAIITGVSIKVIGFAGSPTIPPITLKPYWMDNTSGSDVYYPYTPVFTGFTPSMATYLLGGSNYTFASAISYEQANNFKLNLVANGNISLDSVLVSFFYYIPTTPTPPAPIGNGCVDCNSPIQVQDLHLALPLLANDRFMYTSSFNYADGTPVNYADLGSCGGFINFVIDPDLSKDDPAGNGNFAENTVTAIWTVMPNGNIQFDFGVQTLTSTTRGLMFHTPYTADPTLRSNHNVGARVIISDNAPFLGQLLRQCQIGTVISAPIETKWNDVSILNPTTIFNFLGAGVGSVVPNAITGQVDVTIPGTATVPPQIATTTSTTSGNVLVSTLSATLDVVGLNRGVVIEVSTSGGLPTTVVVGGVSAVMQESKSDAPNNLYSSIWLVAVPITLAPPLGLQTIVVTMSAPSYVTFGAECITGLDQTTPVGTTQNASGTNFNPSLVLTTTYDNSIVIDSLATAQTPILYTVGAGQALNWALTAVGTTRQGGSSIQSAGLQPDAITMDYTITQNTPWVYCAIELKGISTSTYQTPIQFENHGANLGTPGTVDELDFIGAGVTASRIGNKVTINIPGGGGSAITLETNGVMNGDQSLLNLVEGVDVNITDDGSGNVTVDVDTNALANDNTFITDLTNNATFQTDVNNFVSGGGGALGGGSPFLPIGQYRQTGSSSYFGESFSGNMFRDIGTNRIYAQMNNTGIRIFKNDFGSYYVENPGLLIDAAMLTQAGGYNINAGTWCCDGTYLYAVTTYQVAPTHFRIDAIRFDLDGTNPVSVNLSDYTGSYPEGLTWVGSGVHGGAGGICVVGTDLYVIWRHHTTGSTYVNEFRKFAITNPVFALALTTTYTVSVYSITMDNAHSLTYDSFNSCFYVSGGNIVNGSGTAQYINKLHIVGGDLTYIGDKDYDEFSYFPTYNGSTGHVNYTICNLEFTAASYNIYVVQEMEDTSYTGSQSRTGIAYWLTTYTYPIF